ncbi:DUF3380 domain-containing protein [Fertoebacter nigrum]|uniref:DUF3380 domain-containing protein n=1 Tax=Fertoeibacter niger TaxID=2656921 RepID=A0A8X8KN82_9RHOB|nr:N-acetylmuramidase domain-containing protein [Fertoeibacter niger]NUB44735.1 DUF3380 domain-containing protein [Fertoeibacter niger]
MAFDQDVIDEITTIAEANDIEVAALLAVAEVESGGSAFTDIGGKKMPLILYEYHVFYRWDGLTSAERAEAVKQGLASKSWGAIPYPNTQTARYKLLERAAGINEQAAYAACSWGVGQVLGENGEWLGYGTPKAMAERTMQGVTGQVEVMLAFITKRGLRDELNARDWPAFARIYNGPANVADYAPKMARAYKKFAGGAAAPAETNPVELRVGARGEPVARLQRLLRGLGYSLMVDGDFGPATKRQVSLFQADHGLPATGVATAQTIGRLEVLSADPH